MRPLDAKTSSSCLHIAARGASIGPQALSIRHLVYLVSLRPYSRNEHISLVFLLLLLIENNLDFLFNRLTPSFRVATPFLNQLKLFLATVAQRRDWVRLRGHDAAHFT